MLIEIVVAVGIIGLVLIGVSDLMTRSVGVVSFQKQKKEALMIITKKLNDYKTERDTNPDNFYTTVESSTIDPCVIDKPYKCLVTVDKTVDAVKISITAQWQDGGRPYETSLSQSLSRTVK
ncbi:MAG: hypothetical protein UX08_C0010G0026 [Candidatus Collierbacteria bacterium GW2011_GWB1_45_35]|uniref:Type II secretion system protein n=2 Tax=Candidatus Collieribacteriota TaxID=1752725 RepID=A0A837II10_9BACT|nr:MAG: hypothetical protein UW48_C0007G0025 [Microgenomates group bacterium GW2011_GWC1_44_23]KKT95406.1 MAG: hypothetical protein UW96_C0007G0035 [Candidatus Collierbacteria bacterium GW2011_GWA1_45_15]KKU00056.1 MAG: hypothetical protein UX01_C0007G0035 [Candidatus Collierbacteria bacterium GW2011_GWB2_45_17]KKU05155.1 MAG: hypothetical protein UX08_C0010G0026 [Candidatus Collierbacteria bacterium GW2011_GWB1_45_35]KKU08416.1 MAG: hypothetical protein UX11_C0004G0020 [Candidatus Collierbacte